MADPDGVVEVQGTVAPRAATGKRDPDTIVADIEQTRENLTRTLDTLTERVSPANNARRLRAQVAQQVAQQAARPDFQLVAVAVGLAMVGFTIYRIWGRRRE